MNRDDLWREQVQQTVTAVAGPFVTDGGSFAVEVSDRREKRVVVRYSLAPCEDACAISDEGLFGILDEALKGQIEPDIVLELVAVTPPA